MSGSEHPSNHGRTCTCPTCQKKYGSLPLLVRALDEKSPQPSGSGSREEPRPGTSRDPDDRPRTQKMTCSYCGKAFGHRGDLNKHQRTHSGEQPFACPLCEKKFAHASNLHRHVKLHSGDRPYVCETCNRTFNRKDKLDSHRRSKACKSKSGQK